VYHAAACRPIGLYFISITDAVTHVCCGRCI